MKQYSHVRGSRHCAAERGTFDLRPPGLEHTDEDGPPRPPLRFPLKEIARIRVEHPVRVRIDGR